MFPKLPTEWATAQSQKGINPRDMHKGGITHRTSRGWQEGDVGTWSHPGLLLPAIRSQPQGQESRAELQVLGGPGGSIRSPNDLNWNWRPWA